MPGVKDLPMPEDDVHSLKAGEEVAFSDNALANDSDPEDDNLTVTAVNDASVGAEITLPSGANVTLESDGTYTYEPSGEFESLGHGESASDTFEYTVSDGKGHTEVATVTIVVHGNNDVPSAADDSESTMEDASVSDNVLPNDSDPEDEKLTVKSVEGSTGNVGNEITLPSGVKVTLTSDGAYTFDPNGQYESLSDGEEATETFVYTMSDGNGGTDSATVTIVISGKNDPPVAEDDNLGDSPAADPVSASLMLNDSDAENDDLTVMEIDGQSVDGVATISLPSGAIMTIDTDSGALTVDPNRQFDSLDSNETAVVTFDYVISDGEGGTDLATATLTLQGDNSAPYAEDDSKTTLPTSPVSSSMMPNDKISGDVIKEKVSLIFRNDRRFSMSDGWISYTNEAA